MPPKDRQFIGFDAYRKAMDCLKPGDVAILATPPAFRWAQFAYAIEKGLNVFMEKPTTVDGPSNAEDAGPGRGVGQEEPQGGRGADGPALPGPPGAQTAHRGRRNRRDHRLRAYRMHGPAGYFASPPKPADITELLYQVERFHSFLWASGGAYSDFYVHQIDECCWMKGAWPIEAQANGGRHYRGNSIDQNFDNYSVEYIFPDGARLFLYGRAIAGCDDEFASYAHGTKGLAVITDSEPHPGQVPHLQGPEAGQGEPDLAISRSRKKPVPMGVGRSDGSDSPGQAVQRGPPRRGGQPGNAAWAEWPPTPARSSRGTKCSTARKSCAPGRRVALDGPAPVLAGADGKYPVPQPGIVTKREY